MWEGFLFDDPWFCLYQALVPLVAAFLSSRLEAGGYYSDPTARRSTTP